MRILVVEDDAPLASYIRKGLEAEHYAVDVALDGEQGALMAHDLDYDLLVLDLNLPKLDGISLLRNLRPSKPEVPVLVLTARPLVEDRVHALDSGADDCINKPFSYSELSARVRALMRRPPLLQALAPSYEGLSVQIEQSEIEFAGRSTTLAAAEMQMLVSLVRAGGATVRRTALEAAAWGVSCAVTPNAMDVALHRMRKTLAAIGAKNLCRGRDFELKQFGIEARVRRKGLECDLVGVSNDIMALYAKDPVAMQVYPKIEELDAWVFLLWDEFQNSRGPG